MSNIFENPLFYFFYLNILKLDLFAEDNSQSNPKRFCCRTAEEEEEEIFKSAEAKLKGHIRYGSLPKDRNAPLWNRIETVCQLTLDEVSVLQNRICPPAITVATAGKFSHLHLTIYT